ncbi:acetyl/propionyl/methylcrotonyl-CoA carboxylase subunit alpha [Coxiella endosymbiont of Amblyomma nuttalli]|uniref:acetyl/propionyl/methylcrotonyl-CoA carboxylase subunit alpha n=1 Tax=Coxiella endosymbiont of Amblyomma nuttalli TaxID=2749996 RepID=UPI001BADC19B|nr:biotin carboxylase N-terminal domain-containing protein [Coxiella endosymbiont of Amblyomma nuttalli]QTS84001.1 Acetyl-/propionyl-coenzyme A carboxylase alpha chain [Coxiella endosymbiont of Amblyomma nuttalli]
MFHKLLIANRGEIACRIIRTAKKCNINTVAIYSFVDANALHVKLADEAYSIDPTPAVESYLNREKIIEVALQTNADAIHPGYGFLSEDPKFAILCKKNSIIFIGPPVGAITTMGNKCEAKRLMEKIGVPTIPGYHGIKQDLKTLTNEAKKIGFPLLAKAAIGSGGKGIRLITAISDLEDVLQSVKHEAKCIFDNDTILLEKYITPARHIEVQIFFDQQGNGIHLFDRDCSIQRRHQKIIEESIAPNLKPVTQKQMSETAVIIATAVNYIGAGTIEFLVDQSENFYFMEMNTRLQVEHPVTEMVTGLDLVEWQFKVAAGEPLPLSQEKIKLEGHAFEARLYAENPYNNFSPSAGKIIYFLAPIETKNVRFDSGFVQGDTITPHYDVLIAKLIVHAQDRRTALALLQESLTRTVIIGVNTNISFLYQICENMVFKAAALHNTILENNILPEADKKLPDEILFFACLAELRQQQIQAQQWASKSEDPHSPWFIRDHWRLSEKSKQKLRFWYQDNPFEIEITQDTGGYLIINQNRSFFISDCQQKNHRFSICYERQLLEAIIFYQPDALYILYGVKHFIIVQRDPKMSINHETTIEGQLIAPVPGKVIEIFVKPNQKVTKGDRLVMLEVMKMEYTISSPINGVVQSIFCQVGKLVGEGYELLTLN